MLQHYSTQLHCSEVPGVSSSNFGWKVDVQPGGHNLFNQPKVSYIFCFLPSPKNDVIFLESRLLKTQNYFSFGRWKKVCVHLWRDHLFILPLCKKSWNGVELFVFCLCLSPKKSATCENVVIFSSHANHPQPIATLYSSCNADPLVIC